MRTVRVVAEELKGANRPAVAGLPGRPRHLRPHRFHRDARSGRRILLAGLLRYAAPASQKRRHRGVAGDHHRGRLLRSLPRASGFHPALHLSRGHAAFPCAAGAAAARAGLYGRAGRCSLWRYSYATTLVHWRERFLKAWPDIESLGFGVSFRRLWEYYLCYCEAGFRTGRVDVGLFTLRHTSASGDRSGLNRQGHAPKPNALRTLMVVVEERCKAGTEDELGREGESLAYRQDCWSLAQRFEARRQAALCAISHRRLTPF